MNSSGLDEASPIFSSVPLAANFPMSRLSVFEPAVTPDRGDVRRVEVAMAAAVSRLAGERAHPPGLLLRRRRRRWLLHRRGLGLPGSLHAVASGSVSSVWYQVSKSTSQAA